MVIDFSPRGSSKRVSSSTRWRVGSLVPQISLSVMMTWESSVSHSPGPSCIHKDIQQLTHKQHAVRKQVKPWVSESLKYSCAQSVQQYFSSGGGGGWWQTSFDCRMLRRGIHTVPTIVSQINPLFHTSTVRPRSSRLISLDGKRNKDREVQNQEEITY